MVMPILKWPGGKRWLAPKIVPHISGKFKRYFEPFLGGGAILFALEPSEGYVSDINFELITCYEAVKKCGKNVLDELMNLQCTRDEYYRIRDKWYPECEIKRAARLIYLLQHSWNGLYRVNKSGKFNVPYCPRMYRNILTGETIRHIQDVLQRVNLRYQDFSVTISEAKENDLIFVDPPYFEIGRETFGRYSSAIFREVDQDRLVTSLLEAERRGADWILTNGCLEQVRRYLHGYDIFIVSRQSSIAANPVSRRRICEYLVLSNGTALERLRRVLSETYDKVQ